jgi:hypothetical protein
MRRRALMPQPRASTANEACSEAESSRAPASVQLPPAPGTELIPVIGAADGTGSCKAFASGKKIVEYAAFSH